MATKPAPVIRRASRVDAPGVAAFLTRELAAGDKRFYPVVDVREYIQRDVVAVAHDSRRIIGALWMIQYPTYLLTMACAVAESCRRQGVYRRLCEWRTAHARSQGIAWLDTMTRADNRRMREIFRAQGYQPIGTFVAYYQEP